MALDAIGTVQASQLFSPYGAVRYSLGSMPGSYGFTGQHTDNITGLNYFNARYYDPAAGQFTSADTVLPGKGYDPWGLSRYAYVEGNPISRTDPTGHGWFDSIVSAVTHAVKAVAPVAMAALDATTGIPSMITDVKTVFSGNASTLQKIMAIGNIALNVAMDASMVVGVGEGVRAAYMGVKVATEVGEHVGEDALAHAVEDGAEHAAEDAGEHAAEDGGEDAAKACEGGGGGLSFRADTLVATPGGERAIGTLRVGDIVLAYDPATRQVSAQVVQHIWINHDTDLIDLHLEVTDASATKGQASAAASVPGKTSAASAAPLVDETVHTTAKHPFLTLEQGWVTAGHLKLGMHVLRADGKMGVVAGVLAVPGAATMYNLTVSKLHTYEVGLDRWVVHNCGGDSSKVNLDNTKKLQHMYDRHAKQWGFIGDQWSKERDAFKQALIDHLEDPYTNGIPGEFKRQPVTHYYNPLTNLDLMVYSDSEIAGGWKLSENQIFNLLGLGGNVQ